MNIAVSASSALALTADLLFESSPDCAKVLDLRGNLLTMNLNGQCLMEVDDLSEVYGVSLMSMYPAKEASAALELARQGQMGHFVASCPTTKGVPKFWDVRVTPIHGIDGQLQGFLSVSRDITAMQELLHARERAVILANAQKVAMEQAVSGAPLEQVLGTLVGAAEACSVETMLISVLTAQDGHLWHCAAPSLPQAYTAAINGMATGPNAGSCGTAAHFNQEVVASDIATDPLWLDYKESALSHGLRSCWSQPIRSPGGAVLGTLACYRRQVHVPTLVEKEAVALLVNTTALILDHRREITERKQAAEDLRQLAARLSDADHRKTEFLATLAHELRNPLAPMQNGLEVLRLAGNNPETAAKMRDMMQRQLSQMVHLVDDLLDVARISSGKVELRKEKVELKAIVTNAVESSLAAMEAAHHALDLRIADESLVVEADPVRLVQVIGNLLTNAAKYTPEHGRIELSVSREGQHAVIAVTDNGIGIPERALPILFEMFFQVSNGTAHSQGGLGIGLSLVRRLVEMHGGTVTAASPGEGKGSTFTVNLPIVHQQQVDAPLCQNQVAPIGKISSVLKVLVADDNVDAAESLAILLELGGHQATVAHDGHAALRLVVEGRPDFAFLDIGMPGLTGYEVARMIRQTSGIDQTVLVALTGWGADHDQEQARKAGFNHHLTKPADIAAIDALLTAHSARAAT